MSKYEAITSWLDKVVASVDSENVTKLQATINSIDAEKIGTDGVFTDVNIATLDEYIDGSSMKACYVTFRLVMPYAGGLSKGSNKTNFQSQSFAAAVKDKIEKIDIDGSEPGFPDLGEGLTVTQIENLDNDPVLENISEDSTKAIYSFQFRIIYLDNTKI